MTPDDFIKRMVVLFGAPASADPKAFVDEYRAVLRQFSDYLYQPGGDILRDTHRRAGWPTCAEVRDALNAVAKAQQRPVDWDAVETDRRSGWRLSDLALSPEKAAAAAAERAKLIADMKKNIAAMTVNNSGTDGIDWKSGQRDGFREMQENSPTPGLHMTPEGLRQLTERSRRMSGEDTE